MDLKQLEYFICVAELGGFTRASIALDIAQPALSRQIRLLEVELGQTLLVRNGRGVTTTEAGKLLLEHSQGILYQVERLREELSKARGALVGRVALGLPPSLAKLLSVPISRAFAAKFPAARLSIREGLSMPMQESLLSGRLDLALLYNAASSPDIDLIPLLEEELFLVSPGGSGPQPEEPVPARELAAFPLIIPSRPNAMRMLLENQLANLGLRPNISLEIDGVAAILDLVADGFGHALLSRNAVTSLSPDRPFALRPIMAPKFFSKLSMAFSSRRQITATQEAVIDLLKAVVDSHLGSPTAPE